MRQRLPINEHFLTLQGEAIFTGTPSLFVRLQGCPVGCGWCDTKYTWDEPGVAPETEARHIANKLTPDSRFAWLTPPEILGLCPDSIRHVVLTGGEPAIHDLTEISALLINSGRTVQIETSGTFPILAHPDAWVTVSPKLDMPGGRSVLDAALARASEIKFPVGKERDLQALRERILPRLSREIPIYLQPLSLSKRATGLCVEAALRHGWRVSIQVHKLIGIN